MGYSLSDKVSEIRFIKRISTISLTIIKVLSRIKARNSGNVVIIALHNLGDSVLTIPSIREVIRIYGDRTKLLVFKSTYPVYRKTFHNIKIETLQSSDFILNGRLVNTTARRIIKKLEPEVIIDLTPTIRSIGLILFSGAKTIIGTNHPVFKALYDKFIPIEYDMHLSKVYLKVISLIDMDFEPAENHLAFKSTVQKIENISIHPQAGWKAKEWNLSKFISLYDKLSKEFNCRFVLEKDKVSDDFYEYAESLSINFIETENLDSLMKEIEKSDLVISNDSGPLHIANLLGKVTFAIFGPTNPEFHMPINQKHHFVQLTLKCSPPLSNKYCFTEAGRKGCPSFECLEKLSSDKVHNALVSIIENINSGRKIDF